MKIETIPHIQTTLGEGPIWDQETASLYWVDILEKKLYGYQPEQQLLQQNQLPQMISAFALKSNKEAVVALEDGFYFLDLENQDLQLIEHVEKDLTDNRFNDGKCDAAGRFFAGTLNMADQENQASLYCLDNQLQVERKLSGLSLSNGLDWSADNRLFYLIDTPKNAVYQFGYDLETSTLSNQKQIIDFSEEEGFPDGMTMDAEGMLWIAHFGGARVSRWNPENGWKLEEIELPALNITSCTFGGLDLEELYITTATDGMEAEQFKEYPLSGNVLKIKPGVKGTKSQRFRDSVSL